MGRPRRHHVVPKAYLARWSTDAGIETHDVVRRQTFRASTRDVGVVKNFYRRVGTGGEADDDVERHIGVGETKGLPRLRTIQDRWPLSSDDKAHVAALLAVQLVRGIRFRTTHDRAFARTGPALRRRMRDTFTTSGWLLPNGERITEEQFETEFAASMVRMGGNNERLAQMLHPVEKIASVLASMQWSLLQFDDRVLVTSDEPVVVWPRSDVISVPRAWSTTIGLLQSLEIRFPVSPSLALVLTWLDEPDEYIRRAPPSLARNLNAFTVAHASRQWFSVPDESLELPRGRPVLAPLSPMIHPGYRAEVAEASTRRIEVDRFVNERLGADPSGHVRVHSVIRRPAWSSGS